MNRESDMSPERPVKGSRPAESAGRVPSPGRRRVLTGGSVATPIILTLTSTPVTAVQCLTASASTSLHPSGQARHALNSSGNCTGLSPATWTAEPSGSSSRWNLTSVNRGSARFNSFFTPGLGGDPKFEAVVNPANSYTPNGALARAVATSLLNVRAGYVPPLVLTEALVKKIWTDCNGAGFQPTAGVTWGAAEAAAWLATTWT